MKFFCFKCLKETKFTGVYVLYCTICHLSPAEATKQIQTPLRLRTRPK